MRPALFHYRRPESLEETLELMAEYGDEASLLAGGQSLVPMLNMRVARPTVVADINRVQALSEIVENPESVRLGSLTRYSRIESDAALGIQVPLLAMAMPLVAHVGVRNRGTLGGSLALADPAAECPACCVSLNSEIVMTSRSRGRRKVPAEKFFQGTYTTLLEPDELIVAVDLPKPKLGQRFAIREVAARHGDFALAGLCGTATLEGGELQGLRLVYFGLGDRPILALSASQILTEARDKYREALPDAATALRNDIEFADNAELSAKSRYHLARTLLERVLVDLGGAGANV